MTADLTASVRASRIRVPRSRGALSGVLLILLGLWAALVPFIGPAANFAFTPSPNTAWHWTEARGWLEVLPGAAAFLGGLLLLVSASRLTTSLGGWLGVAAGAWLVVGPSLTDILNLNLGTPDPASSKGVRALEALLFFYAIGAAMLFFAALAIGRLSVHSMRDVRAAERRTAAEQAAAEEERRAAIAEYEREQNERRLVDERRAAAERQTAQAPPPAQAPAPAQAAAPAQDPSGYADAPADGTVDGPAGRHGTRTTDDGMTYPANGQGVANDPRAAEQPPLR